MVSVKTVKEPGPSWRPATAVPVSVEDLRLEGEGPADVPVYKPSTASIRPLLTTALPSSGGRARTLAVSEPLPGSGLLPPSNVGLREAPPLTAPGPQRPGCSVTGLHRRLRAAERPRSPTPLTFASHRLGQGEPPESGRRGLDSSPSVDRPLTCLPQAANPAHHKGSVLWQKGATSPEQTSSICVEDLTPSKTAQPGQSSSPATKTAGRACASTPPPRSPANGIRAPSRPLRRSGLLRPVC
ncbi:hypothetical protein SAMN05216268_13636 [Streptomyces yunnanensis]|uniref:Uncharacterized protein n=1 Tax=Streptomyces yunnanensis TaxID=156453 RepID=A0A9X8R0A7_9ACTN|nr:hypothetical protein SAMN05216268_13636 [Streptomyces yunnanensis]